MVVLVRFACVDYIVKWQACQCSSPDGFWGAGSLTVIRTVNPTKKKIERVETAVLREKRWAARPNTKGPITVESLPANPKKPKNSVFLSGGTNNDNNERLADWLPPNTNPTTAPKIQNSVLVSMDAPHMHTAVKIISAALMDFLWP